VEPFDIGSYANPDYYFGYDNPQFRTLIDTLNATTDDSKRKELAGEAQTMLAKDAVNTFLFELPQIGVWNSKLSGFWQNAPIEGVVLRDIRWAE
jgi:peptide/nickel transport system substrate-binding protein